VSATSTGDAIGRIDETACVWQLVERRARATPDKLMLIDERDRSLTFAQFALAAEYVAAGLMGLGVEPGSSVSWQLPTNLEAAVLMAALSRLAVVQNPVLPVLRRKEVGYILDKTNASTFIVPTSIKGFDHATMARDLADQGALRPLILDGSYTGPFGLDLPTGDPTIRPPVDVDPGATRWLYFTSGTTADPKGVRHSDPTILATSNAMTLAGEIGEHDIVCAPVPFTHVGGMMMLVVSLRTGCQLVLIEAFDPMTTPGFAARHRATIVGAVPVMIPSLLAAQQRHGAEPLFPAMRYVLSGAAAVPAALQAQVKEQLGGIGVTSPWGLTEAPQVTYPSLDATDEQLAGTVGRAVLGVEVRVTDADGNRCANGTVGELRVRGPQVFLGYVDAALDAHAIDTDGFLRTGDLGTIDDDGYVRITGRVKDVIIRNGENISAQEVEQTLLTHPAIAEVAAIGLPDERTGERCCAVVVLASGAAEPALGDLRAHFEAAGVARHKVPEQLVVVDVIPRNDMGKAQKQLVRQLVADRLANDQRPME